MSISVLKKKTNAAYNNSSVGKSQFSINGGLRNQGFVGQESLSRTTGIISQYGSCNCGGSICSFNNPSVIKPSVLNNSGMLSTTNRWTKRGKPFTSVKTVGGSDCSDFTKKIGNKNIKCFSENKTIKPFYCKSFIKTNNYNNFSFNSAKTFGNPTKKSMNSSSQYIENRLATKCNDDSQEKRKYSYKGTPFACGINSVPLAGTQFTNGVPYNNSPYYIR